MSGQISVFRNAYQHGLLSILYSAGAKPLDMWDVHIKNGYIQRFLDPDLKALVLEIGGNNVSTTYIMCPKGRMILGIVMPFMVMIVKNLKKYFTFEVTIRDALGSKRRFRVANFQSTTQIMPMSTVMPIGLADGWNQIQFNLSDFCRRAYNTQFLEVLKIKINANIRLRRVYFAERLLTEDELPNEYKLYFPFSAKPKMKKPIELKEKENIEPVQEAGTLEEVPRNSRDSIRASEERPPKQSGSRRKSSVVVQEIKRHSEDKSDQSIAMDVPQVTNVQAENIEVGGEVVEGEKEEMGVAKVESAKIIKTEKESVHSIKSVASQKISKEKVPSESEQQHQTVHNIDTRAPGLTEEVNIEGQSPIPETETAGISSSSTKRASAVRSLGQIREEVNELSDVPEPEIA